MDLSLGDFCFPFPFPFVFPPLLDYLRISHQARVVSRLLFWIYLALYFPALCISTILLLLGSLGLNFVLHLLVQLLILETPCYAPRKNAILRNHPTLSIGDIPHKPVPFSLSNLLIFTGSHTHAPNQPTFQHRFLTRISISFQFLYMFLIPLISLKFTNLSICVHSWLLSHRITYIPSNKCRFNFNIYSSMHFSAYQK